MQPKRMILYTYKIANLSIPVRRVMTISDPNKEEVSVLSVADVPAFNEKKETRLINYEE